MRDIFWRLYEFSREHPQYFALMFVDRSVPRISREYERFAFAREMKERLIAEIQRCIDAKRVPPAVNAGGRVPVADHGPARRGGDAAVPASPPGEDADDIAADILDVTLAGLQTGVALRSRPITCAGDEARTQPAAAHVS